MCVCACKRPDVCMRGFQNVSEADLRGFEPSLAARVCKNSRAILGSVACSFEAEMQVRGHVHAVPTCVGVHGWCVSVLCKYVRTHGLLVRSSELAFKAHVCVCVYVCVFVCLSACTLCVGVGVCAKLLRTHSALLPHPQR
jgi:hypothetical protein